MQEVVTVKWVSNQQLPDLYTSPWHHSATPLLSQTTASPEEESEQQLDRKTPQAWCCQHRLVSVLAWQVAADRAADCVVQTPSQDHKSTVTSRSGHSVSTVPQPQASTQHHLKGVLVSKVIWHGVSVWVDVVAVGVRVGVFLRDVGVLQQPADKALHAGGLNWPIQFTGCKDRVHTAWYRPWKSNLHSWIICGTRDRAAQFTGGKDKACTARYRPWKSDFHPWIICSTTTTTDRKHSSLAANCDVPLLWCMCILYMHHFLDEVITLNLELSRSSSLELYRSYQGDCDMHSVACVNGCITSI